MPHTSEKTEIHFDYHTHILHEAKEAISRSRRLLEQTDGLVRPPYKGSPGSKVGDDRREEANDGRAEDPSS